MKKLLFLLCITMPLMSLAQEKMKFGIKIFPSLSWSRVSPERYINYTTNDTSYFSGNGLKLRGGIGVFGEYYFTENYAVVVGLNYLQNASGFEVKSSGTGLTDVPFNEPSHKYSYNLKYIQLPVSFKVLTNEIMEGIKVYVQAGLTLEYLVGASINGLSEYQNVGSNVVLSFSDNVSKFNSSLVISPGLEYSIGENTRLLVGLTYCRGFFNVNSSNSGLDAKYSSFGISNDYIALDLGVKF